VYEIKLWNKNQALELVMRHLGILDEPVDTRPHVPAFILPPETPGVSVH